MQKILHTTSLTFRTVKNIENSESPSEECSNHSLPMEYSFCLKNGQISKNRNQIECIRIKVLKVAISGAVTRPVHRGRPVQKLLFVFTDVLLQSAFGRLQFNPYYENLAEVLSSKCGDCGRVCQHFSLETIGKRILRATLQNTGSRLFVQPIYNFGQLHISLYCITA